MKHTQHSVFHMKRLSAC